MRRKDEKGASRQVSQDLTQTQCKYIPNHLSQADVFQRDKFTIDAHIIGSKMVLDTW